MENESVVAATLKKFKGKIRLVDARETLQGFQFQSGLKTWPFLQMKKKADCDAIDEQKKQPDCDPNLSYFDEYTNYEDVPENQRA